MLMQRVQSISIVNKINLITMRVCCYRGIQKFRSLYSYLFLFLSLLICYFSRKSQKKLLGNFEVIFQLPTVFILTHD